MRIRHGLVLGTGVLAIGLCVLGAGCDKKDAGGAAASKNGGGQITITEGGTTQPGKATVEDAAEGQKAAVITTPGDKKD